MNKLWMVLLLLLTGCSASQMKQPYTPTVKILGDSISKGYLPFVKMDLKDEFFVSHACSSDKLFNCNNGQTEAILANMDHYFPSGRVDVITYNSGIHDMSVAPGSIGMPCAQATERTPPGAYYANLNEIADYLEAHGRVVIWVDTTTLPSSVCGSLHLAHYNALGEQVARDHGFYILHIDSKFHDREGVHFFEEGYKYLGRQVSDCIVTAWTSETTDSCERTN